MSGEGHAVEIDVDVTRQEHARFQWWHSFRTIAARVALGFWVALLLILGLLALFEPSSRPVWVVSELIGLLYSLAVWAYRTWAAKRAYASNLVLQAPHHYFVSSDRVKVDAPLGSGEYKWAMYWRAYETPSAFYLYVANALAQIIPKRCFTSEAQMQRFREIVRTALGDKAKGIRS